VQAPAPSTITGRGTTITGKVLTNEQTITKIKASVELKLFLNSAIIFLAMLIRTSVFIRSIFGLYDLFNINYYTLNLVSTDFLSLCCPVVLVASSDIVRSAMLNALHRKRYVPIH
jgi:hypothetical protein